MGTIREELIKVVVTYSDGAQEEFKPKEWDIEKGNITSKAYKIEEVYK